MLRDGARRLSAVTVAMLLVFTTSLGLAEQPISVVVNGRALVMDVPPVIRSGRTLVPLRAIFEALGASVEWNDATRTITGRRAETTITLQIDNPSATVNTARVTLDVPPTIVGGRTLVPARFIAESLGARVGWNEQTRTVTVDSATTAIRTSAVQVTSITDGDTIRVRLSSGQEERVRLIGVDTPESTTEIEPFGKEAAAFTRQQLEGKTVHLELDVSERDRFGRLLAYIWLEQPTSDTVAEVRAKMFNARLLLEGFARIMTIAPNVKYSEMFVTLEREARNANKGLWAATAPPATTTVAITEVDLAGERVVIANRGQTSVDISGWVLVSENGNQRFTFPAGTVIAMGSSIMVVSGPNATAGPGRLVWTRSHIWNNEGDPAVLLDNTGREVSRR
ncbi:MAG: thermonuclease family protein [Selenomonadales bacterium]|nr:thermonuclease family protein [Selenomonadales bacterium]